MNCRATPWYPSAGSVCWMNSAADYLNSHSFFKSCRMTRNISWFSAAKKQNTLMDRRLLIRRYQERRWSHCNQKRASKQLNQLGQDCCPNAEVLTTDNSTKTQVANPGTLWGIPYASIISIHVLFQVRDITCPL